MNEVPFVSIILPIRNEADFIERSLGAILQQEYPSNRLEVLIADGMSEDSTRDIIARIAKTTPIPVKIIENPQRIVPTGFNAALSVARGEVIVRIDGHTIVSHDYVLQCVELLIANPDVVNVGGRMKAVSSTCFGQAVAAATSTPFGVGGARFHYTENEEYTDTVYMGAWWRRTLIKMGGFDEEFVRNQDDEFNYRLRAAGGKILISPKVKSTYYNRTTLRALWRQYYQYGVYKVRVMQKHLRQMRPRQFVPAAFVAGVIGGGVLSLFGKRISALWKLILVVYGFANLFASLVTAMRYSWHLFPYLPVVFLTLHLSYGLGFWRGMLKFRNRWTDRA